MSYIFKYKWMILLTILALVTFGVYSTLTIPKQEMPTLKTPYLVLQITSDQPDAALVLNDMTTEWIKDDDVISVKSIQFENTTLITVEIAYDAADPTRLKTQLERELDSRLPDALIEDKLTVASYDMIFTITGDTSELNDAANTMVDRLQQLPTNGVVIQSFFSQSVQITLSPNAMAFYNLDLLDVINMIEANRQLLDAEQINTIESLQITPDITLNDIAIITAVAEPATTYNNDVALIVSGSFNEDIDYTSYIDDINTIIEQTKTDHAVEITPIVLTPNDVDDLFNDLILSIGLATFIVFVVTLIGLGFRQSLVVIAIVPSVVFITVIGLDLLGYELHKLTIIGLILSIGMMVDNAIVLAEGTKFFLEQGHTKMDAAKKAVHKNKWPILTATITTLLAFSSVAFIPGFIGDLVRSMPVTVIIAMSLSYILSLVLTPILASLFVKKGHQKQAKKHHLIRQLKRALNHPIKIMAAIVVIMASVIYFSITTSDIDLFPGEEKLDFYITLSSDSLNDLNNTQSTIDDVLYSDPIIDGITTSFNTDLPRFHMSVKALPLDMYTARYYINTNGSKSEMESLISTLKSLNINNTNLYVDSMHLSPPDAPLEVILTGDTAQSTARELTEALLDNPLIESVNYTTNQERNVLLASTLNPSFKPYEALMNGIINGQYQPQENVMVGLNLNDDLNALEISDGIMLSDAFSINTLDYQISAHSYNGAPSAYLSITPYQNRNIPVIQDIINDQLSSDLTVTYTGENTLFLTLSNALIISGSIAVFGMFVLLFFQFRKLSDALIILFTVPLSFTGSLIGMLIFQYDITVSSLIGMVSLLGVTVNIGILLIEEIEKELRSNSLKKAVIQGTSNRFRPIILTSATTILGLIPLYITGGDFFRPLAITFIFGMFFATIISIFVIPIMIYLSRIPEM